MKSRNIRALTDELDELLTEMTGKEAEDGSKRPSTEELEKAPSKEQTNIGVEQREAAKDSGSTADKTPEQDEVGDQDMGIKTMDADAKLEQNSKTLKKVKKKPTTEGDTMEEKIAAMNRLGKGVISILEKTSKELDEGANSEKKAQDKNKKVVENLPEGVDKQAFENMVGKANEVAAEYFNDYLYGMVKRAQDEKTLSEMNIDKKVLDKFGGVSGLLDKMAAEDPDAVLPPEIAAQVASEGPVADPVGDPVGEVPAEAPGGLSDQEAQVIEQAMVELGVTPEILDQAMSLIEDLMAQGYSKDDIAMAVSEMMEEAAVPAEAPVEAPVEEPVEDIQEDLQSKVAAFIKKYK